MKREGHILPVHEEGTELGQKLYIIGLGPGGDIDMTLRARAALEESDLIAGYTVYVNLVREQFPDKETLVTPMRKEIDRCKAAIEAAVAGRVVAMVCSGDPGVYGMAGLCYELAVDYPPIEIEVIPGVSASNAGASVLVAPLMHDYAVISLSDLLTPWETIEARLDAAGRSDFVIVLYNPSSHKRPDYLARACDILLRSKSPETACGYVRNIGREGEEGHVTTLGELRDTKVDMFTTVFIGNSRTRIIDGKLVTPRGYLARYGSGSAKAETAGAQTGEAGAIGEAQPQAYAASMREVLVFGGTIEGRTLVEWLDRHGVPVVACSATEYGGSLLPAGERVTSLVERLDAQGMADLMRSHDFACVIDATHPYAAVVSANVETAARECGLELVRIVREFGQVEGAVEVPDVPAAAALVAGTEGNVLLTTGSKDLETFVTAVPDFAERVYARILPVRESIDNALGLGIPASHIIAMQGPFSRELNEALIHELGIRTMVTKASGASGGFDEKVQAAHACGVQLVVIGRPREESGCSLDEAQTLLANKLGL